MPDHEHPTKEIIPITVANCQRCGKLHLELIAIRFLGEPIQDERYTYDWWAICPTYDEPLLVRIFEVDDAPRPS